MSLKADGITFIIHGKDHGPLDELKRLLSANGIKHCVLIDEADKGFNVLDKFTRCARICDSVVVISTPDVVLNELNSNVYYSSPNVYLELGWFMRWLDFDRILFVSDMQVSVPSNLGGLLKYQYETSLYEVGGKILSFFETFR